MSPQDDLPELDANEVALLAAFVEDDRLGATARQRVKARVLESTAPIAPTGAVLRGPWVPWVAGTVLAAAAAALLVLTVGDSDITAEQDRGLQQAPSTPESAEDIRVRQEPAPTGRRILPAGAPVSPVPEAEAPPTEDISAQPPAPQAEPPAPSPPRRGTSTPRKAPAAEAPTAASPSSLSEETRLVDRARQAVLMNLPKNALLLLRNADDRFPNGVFRQERAVLRIVALCDAGKLTDGRTAAAAFLRAHPRSALRSRAETACPEATH